jgi:hypothetical protein
MTDFFVSYNSADRLWAEWIAWQVEDAGYTTVLQAWDFRPGSNFIVAMQQAASEAERIIAVLSPDYLTARFTQPEWAAAFAQDPTGEKGSLLPVRVRDCAPQGLLPQIIYIDLVGLEEANAQAALLAGVRRERAKPAAAPRFPGGAPQAVGERPCFPGALPPIWNVPHLRNPHFTGRVTLLAALRTALTSGQPAALTQAISGLGGVGKTQLAVEYAYRYAIEYDTVWWVRAEESATLTTDYAGLAAALNLPEHVASVQEVVVAVRRWFGHHGRWLLVFDNARHPAEVHAYLPQGATGHVLITSRNPNWGSMASPLAVPVFERAESITFLLQRTPQAQKAVANPLADALGDLPLALAQAAAYIEATGITLTAYLDRFTTTTIRQELLRRGMAAPDYPDTVATTWELAFQAVQETSPAGVDLLHLCAFLAPDDIPRDLLCDGRQHLLEPLAAAVASPLAFDAALAALRRYSLLQVTEEAFAVHRLVQAVTRDRLPPDDRTTWAATAVRLMLGAFPSGHEPEEVRTWPTCVRLLPHALAAAEHTEALKVEADATGELLDQMGLHLRARAQFAEARAVHQRALAITEATYGPNSRPSP